MIIWTNHFTSHSVYSKIVSIVSGLLFQSQIHSVNTVLRYECIVLKLLSIENGAHSV